jgi:hypothetical protein
MTERKQLQRLKGRYVGCMRNTSPVLNRTCVKVSVRRRGDTGLQTDVKGQADYDV